MDKTFKTVGFSTLNGTLKLRFTTDKYRQRVLERRGHQKVQLFDLPKEMTKEAAAEWLMQQRGTPADVKALCRMLLDSNAQVEEVVQAAETPKRRGRPAGKNRAA